MYFLRYFSAFLCISFLSFSYTFAQGSLNPQEVNVIPLDNEDFKRICTLQSTDINVLYRLGNDHFSHQKTTAQKSASIEVEYVNRSNWPSEAINAFEYAVSIWESHLDSDVPIRVGANWTALGEFTLGSAGPSQIVQIEQGEDMTWYSIAQGSAMSGIDFVAQSQGTGSEVDYDVIVNMNSNWDRWYFGTDAQTPNGMIDFVTVVLHEIGHGLGFTGSMRVPDDETAQWGYGVPSLPIIYDRFVIDANGDQVVDSEVYPSPSPELYDAVTSQTGGIFFAGINSISVNDAEAVPLYAPSEWNGGSSYSHVDLATFTNTENALMRPQIDQAFAIHSPGPVTCSIFQDMGWPLSENCQTMLGKESEIVIDEFTTEGINFGVTNVNQTVDRSFTISNAPGAQDPLVGRIGISGGDHFTVLNDDQIIILEPGESIDVVVRYNAGSRGKVTAELEIIHNGNGIESPVYISLAGEALPESEVFILEQNYPNPFNATTTIPYALAQSAEVRLDVFDALGKHVQTLVNQQQSPGRYNQPFRANDVSSGIFIYRLIVDGESKTGKLLLVK